MPVWKKVYTRARRRELRMARGQMRVESAAAPHTPVIAAAARCHARRRFSLTGRAHRPNDDDRRPPPRDHDARALIRFPPETASLSTVADGGVAFNQYTERGRPLGSRVYTRRNMHFSPSFSNFLENAFSANKFLFF